MAEPVLTPEGERRSRQLWGHVTAGRPGPGGLLREKPRPRELRDTARSPGQRGRAGPQARVCGARSLRPPGPGWADAARGKVCWSPTSCVPWTRAARPVTPSCPVSSEQTVTAVAPGSGVFSWGLQGPAAGSREFLGPRGPLGLGTHSLMSSSAMLTGSALPRPPPWAGNTCSPLFPRT